MSVHFSVTEERFDTETLAELLDGRLEPQARAHAVQQLAEDAAAYETFVEAAAITADLRNDRRVIDA